MNRKVGKGSGTNVSLANATVVTTRVLTSTSGTKPDIPKSHPRTLDIPVTPSKAVTIITIPTGDKKSTRGESPKVVVPQHQLTPRQDPNPKEQHQKSSPQPGIHPSQFTSICREVAQIREEHVAIRKSLSEKEGELGKTRVALRGIAQERDFLRNKVSELERILKHSPEMHSHVAAMLSGGNGSAGLPKYLLKSNGETQPAIIPATHNTPVEHVNAITPTSRDGGSHREENQKPTLLRPDIASILSEESPRKCNGKVGHLNKGSEEDGGKDMSSLGATIASSILPRTPHINSPESHQADNNNKKLQQKKQLQILQHSTNKNMNDDRSTYCEEQHIEFQTGNSRNENDNRMPGVTKSNNNNHGEAGGGFQQQHHLSQSGITGLDLMLLGPDCSTKVVEHLVHPLQIESSVREIQHTLVLKGVPLNGDRLREVQIEIDRLNSRTDHLRSQNDVLTLNLEDAKSHADRLAVLLGKYESNNVALQLALRYSDQMGNAYEVLLALLETDLGQVLSHIGVSGQPNAVCAIGVNVTRSGNNNNSNDNSPSEVLPPSKSASPPVPTSVATGNGTRPEISDGESGRTNKEVDNNPDNNNAKILLKNLPDKSLEVSPSPPSSMNLVQLATRNRLAAEKAARFLLSRYASTLLEDGSPSGSENNNCGHGYQHQLHSTLSCDSNNSTSNLSNISGESGQSLSPCGDDEGEEHQTANIILERAKAGSRDNIRSSFTPSSTSRELFTPNENGRNGCMTIIASLLPLLGQVHQDGFSGRNTGELEPSIRHLISTLKSERDAVKQTIMDLESGSLESLTPTSKPSSPYNSAPWSPADARKLDLETAVLMQELMAMKEERAELRAQLFLMEKEKSSLELRLRSHESQEEAYNARINYLKSEIMDCKSLHSDMYTQDRNRNDIINSPQRPQQRQQEHQNNGNNRNLVETINNNNNSQNVNWEREALLKKRIHELATTLEKITASSQVREKQNQEMINELNRANGILMQTLDVAKKKYQSRLRKMEDQIVYISERHASQLRLFGERMATTVSNNCKY